MMQDNTLSLLLAEKLAEQNIMIAELMARINMPHIIMLQLPALNFSTELLEPEDVDVIF